MTEENSAQPVLEINIIYQGSGKYPAHARSVHQVHSCTPRDQKSVNNLPSHCITLDVVCLSYVFTFDQLFQGQNDRSVLARADARQR